MINTAHTRRIVYILDNLILNNGMFINLHRQQSDDLSWIIHCIEIYSCITKSKSTPIIFNCYYSNLGKYDKINLSIVFPHIPRVVIVEHL